MRDELKIMGYIVGGTLFLTVLGLGIHAITAPTTVAIDNVVFHTSQAYNDGVAKDLSNFMYDYSMTDDSVKKSTIRSIVVDRYGSYNGSLSPDLQIFLSNMKHGVN